jgi:hypothetical protein
MTEKKQREVKIETLIRFHPTTMVKAHLLNPSPYNPNKMPAEKYEALKDTIRTDGVCEDLVVQKAGLNIIGGHHRWKAIREIALEWGISMPDIPCKVLDVSNDEAKKINLKLNNIHGDPDPRMLGEVLSDVLPRTAVNFEEETRRLGMTADNAVRHIRLVDPDRFPPPEQERLPDGFARSVTLSLEFDSVSERDKVKKALAAMASTEKKKTGDVVAALLSPKRR